MQVFGNHVTTQQCQRFWRRKRSPDPRGGPHAGLHEHPRDGVLDVRPNDENEMGGMGRHLLLLHLVCQHQVERRHQANHVELHALDLGRRNVLPPEPDSDDAARNNIIVKDNDSTLLC